jgi:glycosyltransferase involved in cell wall biosynthesis
VRILIVHNYYQDTGGEDAVFHQEVEALQVNHTVETLTFKNRKGLKGLIQYLLYPYNIWAAFRLRKKVKDFHPEIIHIHNTHYASGPIVFRTAQRLKIPVVFTLHNYRLLCPSALLFFEGKMYMNSIGTGFPWDAVKRGVLDHSILKTFLTAFAYKLHSVLGTWKKIDAYLPLTAYTKNLMLKSKLGINPEKIIVKPNFISNTKQLELNTPNSPSYFIYIGRLSEEKGFSQLINAFNYPEGQALKIVGDGPLKVLLNNLKNPNIEYLGFQKKENVYALIHNATAVIIPSICLEGFPMTLLEAFINKKAVMVSQIIAASEIIRDSENGYLIDPFDFRKDLKRVQEDSSKEMVGKNGNLLFEQQYTQDKVMAKLEAVYKNLVR